MVEQVEQLLQQHKWGEAEAECRALVAEHPTNAKLHALLGLCIFRQGDLARAVEEFQKAVILDPNMWEVHLKLAQALDRLQRYSEALAAARAGQQIQPNDPHFALLIQGLEPLVRDRIDGWERTVNIEYHNVELHGPSESPKPKPEKVEEREEPAGFTLRPRPADLR